VNIGNLRNGVETFIETESCANDEFLLLLEVKTDEFPEETSWSIGLKDGPVSVTSDPYSLKTNVYVHTLCLTKGCYRFVIEDEWDDGFCCDYGYGFYRGYLNGDKSGPIFEGNIFESQSEHEFCELQSCPNDEFLLRVKLLSDKYPDETSFEVSNSDGVIVMQDGPFAPNLEQTFSDCIPEGIYDFKIMDSHNDGICCNYGNGNFEVLVGGRSVLPGVPFQTEYAANFCASFEDQKLFELDLVPDDYPAETSWELANSGGIVVLSGTSNGGRYCVPAGCYTFYIYDSFSDGLCCNYGNGSYVVRYDNEEVGSGGSFTSFDSAVFGSGDCSRVASAAKPKKVAKDNNYEKPDTTKKNHME